jgi:hypothetical protein
MVRSSCAVMETTRYDGVSAMKAPMQAAPEASGASTRMLVIGTVLIVLIPLLAGLL